MKKVFTVSILGTGSRGAESYGRIMMSHSDMYKIVSICDISKEKVDKYQKLFNLDEKNCFTDEYEFFKERRSDCLVLATMDEDHVRQCIKAFELGYDVLLEKPISAKIDELYSLLEAQKKYNCKAMVCHVLRYAPIFVKVKELLDQKVCGDIVMIDSIEQVCFWHQAHSFVRGNWRNSDETSPMILQKCCHDFDLLQYYANSKCETISSIGSLNYFKEENQPDGAADRCTLCKYKDTCTYSAYRFYIGEWKNIGSPANGWPYNVITNEVPLTEEKLYKAIETGPYGRCVFKCDNNVVDNEIVMMRFENGINANLRMTAFTPVGGRIMKFYCTNGEIELLDAEEKIKVTKFYEDPEIIDMKAINESGHNHGGGDAGIIQSFYDMLSGKSAIETSLSKSVESHLMALMAEKSRLENGKLIEVHK